MSIFHNICSKIYNYFCSCISKLSKDDIYFINNKILEAEKMEYINPFDYCDCPYCKKVKYNSENKIWIHLTGNTHDKECGIHNDFFNYKKNHSYSIDSKPDWLYSDKHEESKVIWFSNGSWLYDCYCENNHEINDNHDVKVVIIKNPKKILEVYTLKDLWMFIKNYGVYKLPHKGSYIVIDWNKIYDDGYNGVSINFRKYYHLLKNTCPTLENYRFFSWHYSFDVESLIIFNPDAFNNTVEITNYKIK